MNLKMRLALLYLKYRPYRRYLVAAAVVAGALVLLVVCWFLFLRH